MAHQHNISLRNRPRSRAVSLVSLYYIAKLYW